MICFLRELSDVEELDVKYRETEKIDEIQQLLTEVKNDLQQSMDPADIHIYRVSLLVCKRINILRFSASASMERREEPIGLSCQVLR